MTLLTQEAPMWLRTIAAGLEHGSSPSSEAQIISETIGLLCDPMPFTAAWYGVADFRTKSMRALAGSGLVHGVSQQVWVPPSFATTPEGQAMMSGRIQFSPCDPDDRVLRSMDIVPAAHGLQSRVSVPVRIGSEVGGIISAYFAGRRPSNTDLTLLEQIATDLGNAVGALRGIDGASRPRVAGYLPSVANAQVAPVLVFRAVRAASGDVVDFEVVEANPVGAALLLSHRETLIGTKGACFLPTHNAQTLGMEIVAAMQVERSAMLTDFPLPTVELGIEDRYDVSLFYANQHVVSTWREVTERFEALKEAKSVARQDHLTKLGSRPVFVEQVEDALGRPRRRNTGVAVLVVGIDQLSRINEAMSLAAGDEVIVAFAERMVAEIGDRAAVARLSGDEFAVLLAEERGAEGAYAFAERLQSSLRVPLQVLGQVVNPTASIGISYTDTEETPDNLLHFAGLAMRRAKDRGRGRIEFADQQLAVDAKDRLIIEHAIRKGLDANEFRAWFQPIVDLETGRNRGYEALCRWESPRWEHLSPGRFIPIAETAGMAPEMDLAMMQQSLKLLQDMPRDQFVSINVSVPALMTDNYLVGASTLLAASGIDMDRVHLEVTETQIVADMENVVRAMERLASYGPRWFLDDFGTGYSSLSHLRELPVSGLKLDMSFSKAITAGDASALRLTQGLIGLARGLEMETIAEGVETDVTAGHLASQGWELGQGWLYGKATKMTPGGA